MTDDIHHTLSRRQVLGGLGAVGLASAGAGLGTTAFFNDTESFTNNTLQAGQLDLKIGWQQTYTGLNPTTGEVGTHYVNAFPDHDGDGIQSARGILYGVEWDEDLYVIDLQTGEAIYVSGTQGSSASPSSPNGLAYDPVGNRIYYSVDTGSAYELWFYDFATDSQTKAGDLLAQAAGAGWYDGKYWYVHNRTDDLYAVSFDAAGMIVAETEVYGDLTGNSRVYRFGDVAVNADGLLYGSSLSTGGSSPEFFTVDLTDGTHTTLYTTTSTNGWTGDPSGLQLAFDGVGNLFGQAAGDGTFYEIDVQNKTVTPVGAIDDLRFTDLTQRRDLFLICTRPDPVIPDAFQTAGFNPDQQHLLELTDVKPGDWGELTFMLYLCDNPGYIWMTADNFEQSGGSNPEPEQAVQDSDDGELADHMIVTIWYDEDCDNRLDAGEQLIFGPGIGGYTDYDGNNPATLTAAMDIMDGNGGRIPLDGRAPFMGYDAGETDPERDCLPSETPFCVGVMWELPEAVGNEVQGDSLSLDLGFYTEQCRHNDGSGVTSGQA